MDSNRFFILCKQMFISWKLAELNEKAAALLYNAHLSIRLGGVRFPTDICLYSIREPDHTAVAGVMDKCFQ